MVFDRITAMIEDVIGKGHKITPDMYLMRDLSLDSLDIAEMIMDLEDEFEMEIDEDDRERIRTVADLVNVIESKM